jgi:putative ABC transport system permease protein
MIRLLRIALRNLLRNRRRSLMTIMAIATGSMAMLCFGQFIARTVLEFETIVVRSGGHLAVFRKGYYDFGAGNPAAYGIDNYQAVMGRIARDPALGQMLAMQTPTIAIFGVASNPEIDATNTFFGAGLVPADTVRMRAWDDYGLYVGQAPLPMSLREDEPGIGVVGVGMARILGLCGDLKVPNCPEPPTRQVQAQPGTSEPEAAPLDFASLAQRELGPAPQTSTGQPVIDLLTATAAGAPNVAKLRVVAAEAYPERSIDMSRVEMNFSLAQSLLYGQQTPAATAILVQLRHTSDLPAAKTRLNALFEEAGLPLEVRDMRELNSFFDQATGFLNTVFIFIAAIIAVIVLFMVVNTTTMAVMERVNEIGTSRALGAQRWAIRTQFALEGSMLGAIGATLGVVAAELVGIGVTALKIPIYLPGSTEPGQLTLLTSPVILPMMTTVWLVLVGVAVVAAFFPANQAARMKVVDALRHV